MGDLSLMNKYTTILYDVKKELEVSLIEYIYLDTVYHLQAKTGWAFALSNFYCERMDITDRQLRRLKGSLVERGLLEIQPQTKDRKVRVTEKYLDILQADKMSVQKVEGADKMSAVNGQNVRDTIENKKEIEIRYSADAKYHPDTNKVIDLFSSIAPTTYTRWYRIAKYRENITALLKTRSFEQVKKVLETLALPVIREDEFCPTINNPAELLNKFDKTVAYLQRKYQKSKKEADRVF